MFLITSDWNKQCKSISINHLLTLCELGDDYKSFCDDLEILIESKSGKDYVSKAYKVMQGKFSIHSRKYKDFIKKHNHVIEIMNKYHCLSNLTYLSYDAKGKRRENLPEDYFYEYLNENKKDIETIKEVALKLKSLGFSEIKYGENLDFTQYKYSLDSSYGGDFAFLENIEINSSYLTDPIKYKTSSSCYCMCLETWGYGTSKEVRDYGREIYLNSLILDPNSLPSEITTESTIGVIKKLAVNKKTEYSDIRNSVDISIATMDLKSQFEHLQQVIDKIDKVKDDEELKSVLEQMQNVMTQLQTFGENFEKDTIESNTDITEEKMEKEKKLYLNRRFWSSFHID